MGANEIVAPYWGFFSTGHFAGHERKFGPNQMASGRVAKYSLRMSRRFAEQAPRFTGLDEIEQSPISLGRPITSAMFGHQVFLPNGRAPSHAGGPRVSRRRAIERTPRSWKPSSGSSEISRTSPTVFRPAAASTLRIRAGNSTSLIGVSSGSCALDRACSARSFLCLQARLRLLLCGQEILDPHL